MSPASVKTNKARDGQVSSEPGDRIAIGSIKLNNLLSFGVDDEPLVLGPLNILIGPNAVGKSNLVDGLSLLRASADGSLPRFVSDSGGIREWIWKGMPGAKASLEVVVPFQHGSLVVGGTGLRYYVSFRENEESEPAIVDEWLESDGVPAGEQGIIRYRTYVRDGIDLSKDTQAQSTYRQRGAGDARDDFKVRIKELQEELQGALINSEVISLFRSFTFYRSFTFSRNPLASARTAQPVGRSASFLSEDASNLPVVLKSMSDMDLKRQLQAYLKELDADAVDFEVKEVGKPRLLQLVIQEGDYLIDASRFSDGTLRWLSLLAILLHPTPPPLICLEDPEIGLHPDMLPILADLLRQAATRTQLIVTTQSVALINNFTDSPQFVFVCEKEEGATKIRQLNPDRLALQLEKYKLGSLWTTGQIGGNRF
jgi:predicted ATPase